MMTTLTACARCGGKLFAGDEPDEVRCMMCGPQLIERETETRAGPYRDYVARKHQTFADIRDKIYDKMGDGEWWTTSMMAQHTSIMSDRVSNALQSLEYHGMIERRLMDGRKLRYEWRRL